MDQISSAHLIGSSFLVIIGLLIIFIFPKQSIIYVTVIMSFLGYIRRLFMSYFAFTPFDSLVVVGFTIMLMYFVSAILNRKFSSRNALGKAIIALGVVLFLEMFNPLQGGFPLVGIYGGLVFFGLLGAYQLGRTVGDKSALHSLSSVLIGLAVIAGAYGLYQIFFGFSSIEKEWIYRQKLAPQLGGMRVFSLFSSFSEYVQMMTVGAVICFVRILKGNRLLIPLLLFLIACIIASSSRSGILMTSFTLVILWAIQGKDRRTWWPRLTITLLILPFILINGLSFAKESSKNTMLERLVEHQADGISDPLNDKKSTGGGHVDLIVHGFQNVLTQPLGRGTGALTIAAGKFKLQDEELGYGSEGDISDMFITTGFIGGVIYSFIIVFTFIKLLEQWQRERQESTLMTLAVLIVTLGWWTSAAHYALPFVIWFLIGSVERRESIWQLSLKEERKKRQQQAALATVPNLAR